MKCPTPINVRDTLTGGYIQVPCGKCYNCMMTRRQEWVYRLRHEVYNDTNKSFFITLTYDDDHLDLNRYSYLPEVSVRTCQLFFKSLRKLVPKFRYFLCSEYGPREQFSHRPHYHMVLMFPKEDPTDYSRMKDPPVICDSDLLTYKLMQAFVEKAWQRGFVQVATVTPARIAYVTKYCLKYQDPSYGLPPDQVPERKQGFCLMSRNPGIGSSYLTDAKKTYFTGKLFSHEALLAQGEDGKSITLPRYYRNKLPELSTVQKLANRAAQLERERIKEERLLAAGMSLHSDFDVMKEREKRYIRKLKK